ncbi:D-alanine-D-alanine ligase [Thermoflavifilum aggregans]|uniref:D-alanine--D-alanine ligase n=1 Tax=Thermoflavifilum aggregans TaxID=454188 RepID=A0A2M9CU42_9BACT|nr:D-alanine--D-alanine ligase [Thermoflavifilum aggregans]PJJ75403.1 D-alanine-D-alanine ligase [Thermoflavifilum aggregans]
MPASVRHIALLCGGYSGEYEISLQSAETVEKHLRASGYEVYKILITRSGWNYVHPSGQYIAIDKNDFSILLNGEKIVFDAVFNIIHGTPGEDGRLQGYLDMLGIPYTGCNAITSAVTFNKAFCNKIVASYGIVKVARSVHLIKGQPIDLEKLASHLSYPCFVKPAEGGSSVGISKVKAKEELGDAVEKAFAEDEQILIETYIKGRELTCGLFGRMNGEITVLPITEIVTQREFFDYVAKYTPGASDEITPADIPVHVANRIRDAAKTLYLKLNCKGLVRIDFILEEGTEDLYFLEVNTVPGQSANSIVPKQIRAAGMQLSDVYQQLIEDCLLRAGVVTGNQVKD